MTIILRCEWCGAVIARRSGRGRPPRFCRRSHRQRHYEARRLAAATGLQRGEALVGLKSLRDLQDSIYLLQTVIEDAEADLADEASLRTYTEAFRAMHQAAQAVVASSIEAKAVADE